eukprot:TRINITY_DN2378_c0_g1_i1.p2 TRINITY_DN2378_c0_g1~~TRINITY_DN2378_c0_g1_i1.p2  ORF type:complete len:444 (-),score=51.21 TRINITY_DN2378_c0_g1_i1:1392-2723(-)
MDFSADSNAPLHQCLVGPPPLLQLCLKAVARFSRDLQSIKNLPSELIASLGYHLAPGEFFRILLARTHDEDESWTFGPWVFHHENAMKVLEQHTSQCLREKIWPTELETIEGHESPDAHFRLFWSVIAFIRSNTNVQAMAAEDYAIRELSGKQRIKARTRHTLEALRLALVSEFTRSNALCREIVRLRQRLSQPVSGDEVALGLPVCLGALDAFGCGACISEVLPFILTSPCCVGLTKLSLRGCAEASFHAVEHALQALPNLQDLDLSGCVQLDGSILSVIARCLPRLHILELANISAITDNLFAQYVRSLPQKLLPNHEFTNCLPTALQTAEQRVAEAARRAPVRAVSLIGLNLADTSIGDAACQALGDCAAALTNCCLSSCYRVTMKGLLALCSPHSRLNAINTAGCYKIVDVALRHACTSLPQLRSYVHSRDFRQFLTGH